MRVEPTDEKPITMNPSHPVYKVVVWERLTMPADVPAEQVGYNSHEWTVSEADAPEVLEWAKNQAGSNEYEVYVAGPYDDGSSTLLRLCGTNPNATCFPPGDYFTLVPGQD